MPAIVACWPCSFPQPRLPFPERTARPGRSWKCKSCNGYNPKSSSVCGFCEDKMRFLAHGGSSQEDPIQSYEQVPPNGYGDGYGNYGAYGKGWQRPHGYASNGQWPLREMQRLEYFNDMGYGPMRTRSRLPYSATYGGKGKGKGSIVSPSKEARERARTCRASNKR